jgi:hypothetical protein
MSTTTDTVRGVKGSSRLKPPAVTSAVKLSSPRDEPFPLL